MATRIAATTCFIFLRAGNRLGQRPYKLLATISVAIGRRATRNQCFSLYVEGWIAAVPNPVRLCFGARLLESDG